MRNFIQKRQGLNRDADGHRTGFKIYIKIYKPMTREGFLRWGVRQRPHIGKHQICQRYYTSTTSLGFLDGIPISECKNNKLFGTWLINHAYLGAGEKYGIYSWRGKSSKNPIPVLTKQLCTIEVYDIEKYAFKITKDARLNRYFFRKADLKGEKHEEY